MNILYFDMPSGISGDMTLGALLDLGADEEKLKKSLDTLGLSDKYTFSCGRKNCGGIDCFDVHIHAAHEHAHRHYGHIKEIIEKSGLTDRAKKISISIFQRIAEAEGKVHGKAPEEVHFHEVGAIDSIVDICGFGICADMLDIDEICFGTLPAFTGTIECAHGIIPLPAPAVCELTKGLKYGGEPIEAELITPTGAAILGEGVQKSVTNAVLVKTGFGSGKKDIGRPNYLRAILYKTEEKESKNDKVLEIEFETDDMSPELYPNFSEKLLSAGALDVFALSALMKKGRPGLLITVLCPSGLLEKMAEIIFAETTTIGFRYIEKERITLERKEVFVNSKWGQIKAKQCSYKGKIINIKPESEDMIRISKENDVPLKEVYETVK